MAQPPRIKPYVFKLFLSSHDPARFSSERRYFEARLLDFIEPEQFSLFVVDVAMYPYIIDSERIVSVPTFRMLQPEPAAEYVGLPTEEDLRREFRFTTSRDEARALRRRKISEAKNFYIAPITKKRYYSVVEVGDWIQLECVDDENDRLRIRLKDLMETYQMVPVEKEGA